MNGERFHVALYIINRTRIRKKNVSSDSLPITDEMSQKRVIEGLFRAHVLLSLVPRLVFYSNL